MTRRYEVRSGDPSSITSRMMCATPFPPAGNKLRAARVGGRGEWDDNPAPRWLVALLMVYVLRPWLPGKPGFFIDPPLVVQTLAVRIHAPGGNPE